MKKRLIWMVLAGLLVLGLTRPAAAAYSDVPADHWAAEAVARATELGLFQGEGGGKFGLGRPITRAAFATALTRLFVQSRCWETGETGRPEQKD